MSPFPRLPGLLCAIVASVVSTISSAAPISVLFVGNSYTFGRVDPVMSYNAANVSDLTRPGQTGRPSFDITSGSNVYEPHNWGGVAGIFKQMTVQQGLDYDVSISARNAASLRGHFLNTSNTWDLQGNLGYKAWDQVVLQDLSDEPLPSGRGGNANQALFNFYANKIEDYLHNGIRAGQDLAGDFLSTTESLLWGGPASGTNTQRAALCVANSGLSQASCNAARTIKANANERADTQVFLYQTWARPDMVYAHTATVTDQTTGAILPGVGAVVPYYSTLEDMTTDLHDSYHGLAASNSGFKGVAGVGDAFLRAVQTGVATRNPYAADALTDGLIDLWWDDELHASKYGSYLSALTLFGSLTGLDPARLGASEVAARDLGISSQDALALQRVASDQLGYTAPVPEPASAALVLIAGLAAWGARRKA
jgi:hypothetical protein